MVFGSGLEAKFSEDGEFTKYVSKLEERIKNNIF